ncbi:MAG: hypothetical protein AMJ54_13225 [Deltaproteobacteria bacterium SG8_13]|nr:MAG: hypothetical protein AMJ54_13225 [Deltaproteobacteria bacterium SG8_13]
MPRGGKRKGAGRPKGTTVQEPYRRQVFTCRLPRYVIEWLRQQDESQGRLIARAVVDLYAVKPPRASLRKR